MMLTERSARKYYATVQYVTKDVIMYIIQHADINLFLIDD